MKGNKSVPVKRIVDIGLTVLLLCVMAYQVTGEVLHEWIGIGMTVLVIVHQIMNRKWYGALFKGKYNAYRIVTTVADVLLLVSFALTAVSGMSMSGHAVPFLNGIIKPSLSGRLHLSMSHWSFVLMGFHLGLHIPAMVAAAKPAATTKRVLFAVFGCVACVGLFLFATSKIPAYLFFRVPFAFLDYNTPAPLVFLENLAMLMTWAFVGTVTALLCSKPAGRKAKQPDRFSGENRDE